MASVNEGSCAREVHEKKNPKHVLSTKKRQAPPLSITCMILSTSPQTYKVDPVVPILQMKKLKFRRIHLSETQLESGRGGI